MAPYPREPSDAVCWNCDRRADETVRVTLQMPTGDVATFALCRVCLDGISPTLAAADGQIGIRIDRDPTVLRDAR